MMFMHTLPFGLGIFEILLLGGIVAAAGYFVVRRIKKSSSRDRVGDDRGTGGTITYGSSEAMIYRLAKQHHGRLTVSDVVIAAGTSPSESERMLNDMTDGIHITMEVTDRGTMVYEFPELMDSSPSAEEVDQST